MDVNRNTQIVINDDLLRKIVYCIEKAIGDDLQQYLRENHRETNNAIILLRGDNINTNLRTHVVKDDIDLVPFQRYGWSGRMVIDRKEHITYSIMTEGTLSGVPKKKNRENPHYLQSVLYVENKDCIAKERQMTLEDFGITIFDTDVLEQDFEKISQGMINVEEDYKHYIIAYKAENGEIKDIKLRFLDKDFNIVDIAVSAKDKSIIPLLHNVLFVSHSELVQRCKNFLFGKSKTVRIQIRCRRHHTQII